MIPNFRVMMTPSPILISSFRVMVLIPILIPQVPGSGSAVPESPVPVFDSESVVELFA